MNHFSIHSFNGLRLILVPQDGVRSIALAILIKVGSRYENPRQLGLAHLYEHLCFRGTKQFPDKRHLALAADQVGADFNGATGKEDTTFTIKLASKHWQLGLKILSELVAHPLLRIQDIRAERPIVLEEINMRRDHPSVRVTDHLLKLLYPANSLGLPTIGYPSSVSRLKRKDFVCHREQYFARENIVLVAAGNLEDSSGIKSLAAELFSSLPPKVTGPSFSPFPSDQNSSSPHIYLDPETRDQFHLALGWIGFSRQSSRRYAQSLLDVILGSGMSSRLFQKIREDAGLAYAISSDTHSYEDVGLFAVFAGIDKRRIRQAIGLIWQELQQMSRLNSPGSITQKELQKAKDYIRGKLVLHLEEPLSLGIFYGSQLLLESRIKSLDQILRLVDQVTLDELISTAQRIFVPDKFKLAGLGGGITTQEISKIVN